jgi:hypothetical protein
VIERHPERHPRAAIVPHHGEPIEPERANHLELVSCHLALRVRPLIKDEWAFVAGSAALAALVFWFVGTPAVAPQAPRPKPAVATAPVE